jgi:hypothetical protein
MKMNMGAADRVIRTLIAIAIGILLLTHRIHGVLAIVLGVVAIVFLATSLVAFCPAYQPLRISTRKEPPPPPGT